MKNEEYFNSVAEEWDSFVNHDEGKIKKILDILQLKKGYSVLDVGTGTGVLIPYLYSYVGYSGKIIAVDVAEKMIDVAKRKFSYKNVQFIVNDVLKTEFPEKHFDCIICYSMFPHFDNRKEAVGKLSKHLRKGGKFVICHSQSRESINNLHKGLSKPVKNDILPTADIISEYYKSAALETTYIADNDNMFVVIGEMI